MVAVQRKVDEKTKTWSIIIGSGINEIEFVILRNTKKNMQRRNFLRSSMLTATVAGLTPGFALASDDSEKQKRKKQEFYELREYTFASDAQQKLVEDYYEKAAIPALNRLGSKNVGVFRELEAKGQARLFVLIPFSSFDAFTGMRDALVKDKAYQAAAAAYLNAEVKTPAYSRIQSSLLKSFTNMPQLMVPEKKPRLLELRRYESHSELAGIKKIHMFNEGGEIEIFKRVGLDPVFFGETIIGEKIPNLTYMIAFDDMPEHDKNWKAFSSDPQWVKLKDLPEYKDTVSTITRTFVAPADFSQV
ncbi:NIPSNAP family protein [Flavitalea sp.]|nr:NIPSNAP family protein [Flavitalea sp.]